MVDGLGRIGKVNGGGAVSITSSTTYPFRQRLRLHHPPLPPRRLHPLRSVLLRLRWRRTYCINAVSQHRHQHAIMVDMEQSQHHKKLSSIEMEVEMRCDWEPCERRVRMTSIASR